MSAEATGWVYRHSPFDGVTFSVHLAIADSVNDQHNQLFWMSVGRTGAKARTSERGARRALRELEDGGFVARVREATQHAPAVYRFLFPSVSTVYESRFQTEDSGGTPCPGGTRDAPRADKSDRQGGHHDPQTQENPIQPKREANDSAEEREQFIRGPIPAVADRTTHPTEAARADGIDWVQKIREDKLAGRRGPKSKVPTPLNEPDPEVF